MMLLKEHKMVLLDNQNHRRSEIQSDLIGELVMNALGQIDHVAYIRYASVYRNFREASDFGKFVKDQIEDIDRL